ncbi:MAG TPA: aspartyl protease family protein [Pyrinomonadaceae bacterium]|nr:aspartyl protease family protein [Pyrinomonadaceae bacterium]
MLFRGPMPAVEVMVNGQGPFLFAIDTGAEGEARVDSSLVERLKLRPAGQVQASDGSGRNTRSLDVFELDSVALGGVTFRAVRAPSRDYNTSPNLPNIDGILGFNLFADYLLTLDYPAKRVRLERGELPAADGARVLSFENPRGIPVVELGVGAHKIAAHIDSGNSIGGFVLPTALVEKLALASPPVTLGRARTISNDVEIKEARLKEKIRLGGYEFAEPSVVYPAMTDDANIGSKVLREFALTFDQKHKRVRLKRQETAKATEPSAAAVASSTVDARDFKDYAGRYGERTVSAESGELFLQRQGGMKLKLIPAGADEFTLEKVPEARVKFVRSADGKVAAINVLNRAGEWEKTAREQP